ncbi:hypothetical protein Hanom_Chr15g01380761 [Helianthus anomalus]
MTKMPFKYKCKIQSSSFAMTTSVYLQLASCTWPLTVAMILNDVPDDSVLRKNTRKSRKDKKRCHR